MTIADIKTNAQGKMDQSIAAFKHNLTKIRTGRANPALLDTIHVEYYGNHVPLSQVANVSLLDARTISVQPWEKGMGAKIEKAIRESDLGLNPANMGDLIRVPMPPMSEERRREMTKIVRALVLAESHLAVHTWPELDAVTLDLYVCNHSRDNRAAAEAAFAALKQAFLPQHVVRRDVMRGETGVAAPALTD